MVDRPFVHLHCHTHYSLLDGASRIPELVQHVKSLGMNAVAMTDHGNLYGAIEFYRECQAGGINPIIGYEAYVAVGSRHDRESSRRDDPETDDALESSRRRSIHHLTLLAQNATGFHNLIKLSSLAFLEGYHRKPRIDRELLEQHSEGLICLSGCAAAEFSEYILTDRPTEAEQLALWFRKVFGKNFYIEIQNNGLEIQRLCADGAIDIANRLGIPLVATSDAHYLRQADAVVHDVLLCINTKKTRSNPKRFKFSGDQFHVRGADEMYQLFPGHEEAVKRTQEIANSVDIQLDFKKRHFPVFTPPAKKTPEEYLRELCEQGMQERYRGNPSEAVRKRLEHELGIICRMGFASYFLIVWDFVRFAGEKGIPASARGSACGAVVSYVLRLSHVDPLEYDLLFERFLDPNRSEAPDIDIDFCQVRREDVIGYVRQKYGEESVAQIATFGTLAAKAAIKDVGRVLDYPLDRVNQLTALISPKPGTTLADTLTETDFRRRYETDPEVRELVDIAVQLEGTNRQTGIHAAGVVIANGPIINHVPVHRAFRRGEGGRGEGGKGEAVVATQWVMGDLEKVGLLKMDFLGLRTLTLLDNTVRMIDKTRGEKIDLGNLPLDDPETYALLQRGDARGVFQLESDGIRELLKRMRPDNIRDLIAILALYRPGPLEGGMVDAYVNRKHGRETPVYPHAVMEEILTETFGVMVYQEQIMRILNRLGGIELSSAYACIKAISKKKYDIIDQRRAEFIQGAQERGLDKKQAEEIFELIVVFGGYGFNKSHTCAYAYVGYQTAYLKTHYTAEFMAALLSSEIEDGNKRDILVQHIDDARRLGVEVLPPSVNASEADFTVVKGRILFGLTAIKGLGRGAAEAIVGVRTETGPFRDFFDFCERIDTRTVSKTAIEQLIKAGGLDCLGLRAPLMQVLPHALEGAARLQEDRRKGQRNLFEAVEEEATATMPTQTLPEIPEWEDSVKLKYEKEALDFYFSSHPLAQHEDDIRRFTTHNVGQLLHGNLQPGTEVFVGGMLTEVRFMNTKSARNGNSRFVRCKLMDFTGVIEALMWPDDFVRHKDDFVEDRVCFLRGTLERKREEPSLVLTKLLTIEQAQREMTRGLVLLMMLGEHSPETLDAIGRILRRYEGACPVYLSVRDSGGRRCLMRLGEQYRINPATVSVDELETLLGRGCVKFTGPVSTGSRNGH